MKLLTFKGGAHPNEGKALSENCRIRALDLQGEFVFPMSQHIGAPAKPVVAPGERICKKSIAYLDEIGYNTREDIAVVPQSVCVS